MNTLKILKFSPLMFILLCCFNSTCNIEKCEEPTSVYESFFSFRLVDKMGNSVIALWGAPYDSDLVSVTTENGDAANSSEVTADGNIFFRIQDSMDEPLYKELKHLFFIKLPDLQGNPCRDIDTLQLEYQLSDNYECPEIWFDYFTVYYNDSLYYSGDHESYLEFLKK